MKMFTRVSYPLKIQPHLLVTWTVPLMFKVGLFSRQGQPPTHVKETSQQQTNI